MEQVSNQPGWFESPDAGTASVNTFNATYGEYGYDVTLTSGEEERGNDFANFRQAAKSGVKYNDLDADGTQDVGDTGLSGWTIAAFADVDDSGTLSAGDTLAGSAVTDGTGAYSLALDPGRYIIVEQVSNQPGWFEESGRGDGLGQHLQRHLRRVRLRRDADLGRGGAGQRLRQFPAGR